MVNTFSQIKTKGEKKNIRVLSIESIRFQAVQNSIRMLQLE